MTGVPLSAPEFILALLDSAPNVEMRAADLVAAAGAFAIDARTIRVALGRLTKQGVLKTKARGSYQVGQRGDGVRRAVISWADAEASLKPWDHRWLAVYLGNLSRSDKSALRARERALRLKGFELADAGLAVRPANLKSDCGAVRDELVGLGMDAQALVMVVDAVTPQDRFTNLWDRAALESAYRQHLRDLEESTARLSGFDPTTAARETLLVGRAVTREIVLDPLLPEELVDTRLRGRMINAMRTYDRLGKRAWRDFYRAMGRS